MAAKPLPCPTLVRQLLRYEPATGKLYWRRRSRIWFKSDATHKAWNTRFADVEAFTSRDGARYLTGTLFGLKLAAHRVAWLIETGSWPDVIDHIDGDGKNNRMENLRSVTLAENQKNLKLSAANTSGHVGVRFSPQVNRWVMQIRCGRGRRVTRTFKTRDAALRSHDEWRERLGYHENHGTERP